VSTIDNNECLLVRPKIARKMLGDISSGRLWQLIRSGEISSYLDGTARRISVESIRAHVARQLAGEPWIRPSASGGRKVSLLVTNAASAKAKRGRRRATVGQSDQAEA
jgi:hypothetical protein